MSLWNAQSHTLRDGKAFLHGRPLRKAIAALRDDGVHLIVRPFRIVMNKPQSLDVGFERQIGRLRTG